MSPQHAVRDRETLIEFRVREEPTRTWVTPVGELDLSSADAFDRCLWEAQAHSRRVVLDLRALVFIDSAGLRSILAARRRAIRWQRHLDVVCGPGQVRRMLAISRVDQLLKLIEPLTTPHTHASQKAAA